MKALEETVDEEENKIEHNNGDKTPTTPLAKPIIK